MEKTRIFGIIASLTILFGLAGTVVYLSPAEMENAYVCTANEYLGIFHRISSTDKTAYYYDADGAERYNRCVNSSVWGQWVPAGPYLDARGLSISDLFQISPDAPNLQSYTVEGSCWQENSTRTEYSHTQNTTHRCRAENATCEGSYMMQERIYTQYNRSTEHCKEKAVSFGEYTVTLEREQERCLRTEDVVCCWGTNSGGQNLRDRSTAYQMSCDSGEDCLCSNLSVSDRVGRFTARGVFG